MWHLDALEQALIQSGWQVETVPDENYPLPDGVWSLTRGEEVLFLEFDYLDGDGRYLTSIDQTYGCSIRDRVDSSCYFYRKSSGQWEKSLQAFIASLDN